MNYNGIDIPAQSILLPNGTIFNSSEIATLMAQNPNFQNDDYLFKGSSGDDFVNHSAEYEIRYHWTPGNDHFINSENGTGWFVPYDLRTDETGLYVTNISGNLLKKNF